MNSKIEAKVFIYKKQSESIQTFEREVNSWVQTIGRVIEMHVQESACSSNISFTFLYDSPEFAPPQDFFIIGWVDMQAIEAVLNNCLDAAREESKEVKFINLIHASRSARSLLALIVEGQHDEIKETHETTDTEEQTSRKDQNPNVKAKRKAKSKISD